MPLRLGGEPTPQQIGDGKSEHAIAKPFEPLITASTAG
jgi:hypothetical protein